jgi:hypothetical protein
VKSREVYLASGRVYLATLAMWPAGLPTGLFDRRGGVQPQASEN